MGFQSLMDKLQEEQHLCREIQTRINILRAAGQAQAEHRTDLTQHRELMTRLGCEIGQLSGELYMVRVEIGKRLDDLLDLAQKAALKRGEGM